MKRSAPDLQSMAVGGAVALGCALVMGVSMASLTSPPRLEARVEEVEAKARQAQSALRAGGAVRLPERAICNEASSAVVQAMSAALTGGAGRAGLQAERAEVLPEADAGGEVGVSALRVRFEGVGSYASAMAMLDEVEALRPLVFVDTVDLVSNAATVRLSISGRSFCSA